MLGELSKYSGHAAQKGTLHAVDIKYLFYNVPQQGQSAQNGNTGRQGPAYTTQSRVILEIDSECKIVYDP